MHCNRLTPLPAPVVQLHAERRTSCMVPRQREEGATGDHYRDSSSHTPWAFHRGRGSSLLLFLPLSWVHRAAQAGCT